MITYVSFSFDFVGWVGCDYHGDLLFQKRVFSDRFFHFQYGLHVYGYIPVCVCVWCFFVSLYNGGLIVLSRGRCLNLFFL